MPGLDKVLAARWNVSLATVDAEHLELMGVDPTRFTGPDRHHIQLLRS